MNFEEAHWILKKKAKIQREAEKQEKLKTRRENKSPSTNLSKWIKKKNWKS